MGFEGFYRSQENYGSRFSFQGMYVTWHKKRLFVLPIVTHLFGLYMHVGLQNLRVALCVLVAAKFRF